MSRLGICRGASETRRRIASNFHLCRHRQKQAGRVFKSQPLLVGQGAHARRRPALHPYRAFHPLFRGRSYPVDEVTAALVHQRAITGDRRDSDQGVRRGDPFSSVNRCGWNEHPCLYITIHQQEWSRTQIRKVRISTGNQYYIDVFLKWRRIYLGPSPSIPGAAVADPNEPISSLDRALLR
jgi:hypothetical protein